MYNRYLQAVGGGRQFVIVVSSDIVVEVMIGGVEGPMYVLLFFTAQLFGHDSSVITHWESIKRATQPAVKMIDFIY